MMSYAIFHGLMTSAIAALTTTGVVAWLWRQF